MEVSSLSTWALSQLSRLLPLDTESLEQIISYTASLSKPVAAEHLKNLLGDSPTAMDFITSFNSRRHKEESSAAEVPDGTSTDQGHVAPVKKRNPRKKSTFNMLPEIRRPENFGNVGSGYIKGGEDDYIPAMFKSSKETRLAQDLEPQDNTAVLRQSSTTAAPSRAQRSRPPPSAAGPLTSDLSSKSRSGPRNASPSSKPKIKASVTGGVAMHGQSTTLDDLDSAIRALEIQTNPSLLPSLEENRKRRCNCMATRHLLLEAAPNCLSCGKIICVKEGLGPCTFCGGPLLSPAEIQIMVRVLREERGKERMTVNNASQKPADVSRSPRPFQALIRPGDSSRDLTENLRAAQAHRDRLLGFQANNARRTRIHDEAADFDTPTARTSVWASPTERALQLKRQQKVLREQEWNARPEWEKHTVVASIDLVGGKVVRRMAQVERPYTPPSGVDDETSIEQQTSQARDVLGAFSHNPLLGALIKPVVAEPRHEDVVPSNGERHQPWRRVQDDTDDNEQWILDGDTRGRRDRDRIEGDCS